MLCFYSSKNPEKNYHYLYKILIIDNKKYLLSVNQHVIIISEGSYDSRWVLKTALNWVKLQTLEVFFPLNIHIYKYFVL